MKIPFLKFDYMHSLIESEIVNAFNKVYRNNWFIQGDFLNTFENAYANFSKVKYSVGVSNGLDAIFLALKTLGIGEGDEVILPSNTYIATVLAVTNIGAIPVFVEPNIFTYNIDVNKIESLITKKTKVIIPVHLYGLACEMDEIMKIANTYNLFVIEDNAQAHGSTHKGKFTGTWGDINATSFYPGKNLGALGDGGAITTDNLDYANKVKSLRNYGSNIKYINDVIGYNMRLDEMQAAFLSVKLDYLKNWNDNRIEIAEKYNHNLHNLSEIQLPHIPEHSTHVFHLYVIQTKFRNEIQDFLSEKGIGTLIHYPIPPHLQKAYKYLGYGKGDLPIAEQLANSVLSLPIWPGMLDSDIEYVCDTIKLYFKKNK